MNREMVSIILPNYNHSKYLEERLKTIFNQTYTDFELIILDDNSTDNSREIIMKYNDDSRVSHIVLNSENSGSTFRQWERGFALAKGKYVWIAESDDYSDSRFLERCVQELEQNTNASFCYTDSHFVNEGGDIIHHHLDTLIEPFTGQDIICCSGKDFIKNKLTVSNKVYNASMVVLRKSFIEKVNPLYNKFRFCGDWFFWIELAILGDVIRVPERLNYFRQRTTNEQNRSGEDNITALEEITYIIFYSVLFSYHTAYWNKFREIKSLINFKDYVAVIDLATREPIKKKIKLLIIGKMYNLLKKARGRMAKEEYIFLKRYIRKTIYAPIIAFLIKNSKRLFICLTSN